MTLTPAQEARVREIVAEMTAPAPFTQDQVAELVSRLGRTPMRPSCLGETPSAQRECVSHAAHSRIHDTAC